MLNIVSCVRKLFQIEKKFDVQPELLKGGARTEDIFTLFFYNKIRSRLSYFTLLFLLYMKRPTIIIVTKPCYQYCTFHMFFAKTKLLYEELSHYANVNAIIYQAITCDKF